MADLTFFSKTPINCPLCDTSFYREELRTGRGRLNAGNLTRELRRTYVPSQKYGEVFPLLYPITVCPSCYYATFQADFLEISEQAVEKLRSTEQERIGGANLIFENLDFTAPRGLRKAAPATTSPWSPTMRSPRSSRPRSSKGSAVCACSMALQ